jgi:predicted nucleic acid-binding protein
MKNDSDAVLVDTNLLIYIYDPRDRRKQERARQVFDRLVASGRAALSVQCLSEFFSGNAQIARTAHA